jgi:hypothetical protein
MIAENTIPETNKKPINYVKPLYYLILLNSIFPYLIWKRFSKNIKEIEFVDTMKFSINLIGFLLFYGLQAGIFSLIFELKVGLLYFFTSLLLVLFYTKTAPTNTED